MALTLLGNSGIKVDTSKISAKTPVIKTYGVTQWSFQVLVDGNWIILSYDNETDANSAYAAIT